MGAKVDPVVSFGCYGAPSQTRLDLNPFSFSFFWGGDATSLPLSVSVGRWNHLQLQGRNNGSGCEGDNGITSVTDELCEPPSNSWISPCWRHFPVNCFIGRLLFFFACWFCRLKIDRNSCNCTAWAINPHMCKKKNIQYNLWITLFIVWNWGYCGLNGHQAAAHSVSVTSELPFVLYNYPTFFFFFF